MHRTTGGSRGAICLPAVLLTAALAAACGSPGPTTTPVPASASPGATASPRPSPTPVPTPALPTAAPTPNGSPAAGNLLLRLTSCDDVCGPVAGTTLLGDGRMIWQAADGRLVEGRLGASGLAAARAEIEGTPALATDGAWAATLRPGAEPNAHGVGIHRFDVVWATGPVVVTSWDPASLADQPAAWDIPEEMRTLGALAAKLGNPVAWLGADAFDVLPMPYVPARHLVVIDLYPDVGDAGDFVADVDDVDWPFGGPIEAAGEPIGPGEDGLPPRCLILDAERAAALRAVETAAGASRDLALWLTANVYDWRRADGFVQVTVIPLLPHETGPCADLVLSPP